MRLRRLFAGETGTITTSKLESKKVLRRAQFEGALGRLPNFALAIDEIRGITGSIVEAGVGSGVSLATLSLLKSACCPDRRVFAFDSFCSFPPEYTNSPVTKPERNVSLLEHAKDSLRMAGVDPSDITFIEGYFSETVGLYDGGPIALLHLDVDLGKSYTDVLEGFWPHVAMGGVVIFDEYDSPKDLEKWPDAKPAIDSFFQNESFEVIDQPYLTRRMIRRC